MEKTAKKKIIIIGAGLAGLSAGCYGEMNNYDTQIFELHNLPGGMCTAWKRQGYTFDGCIHWLMGANPDSQFYDAMNEVGALTGKEFIHHEIVTQIEGSNGKKLTVYADVDKLEKELLKISPMDEEIIKQLTSAIRSMDGHSMPMDKPQDMYNLFDYAKIIFKAAPMMGIIKKFGNISVGEYAEQFKDPFLREALTVLLPKEYSAFILVMILSTYNKKDGSWPIGGSLAFAKGIEKRYLALNGKLHYNSKVESILVENDKAKGVRLADGSEHYADYVISAADGYTTIFKMLEGNYINEEITSLYTKTPTSPTSVQVSLGINCDLAMEPHFIQVKLDEAFNVGDESSSYFNFKNFCYDKSMAPAGKSVVTSILTTNYEYWEKLYEDKARYKAEKEKISAKYIEVFEKRFPYAKGKIEVVDISTPMTYVRYTNAWKGIYMGFMATPKNLNMKVPTKLPKLKNFHMAGQFAMASGGLPTAIVTGKWSILKLCKEDGKKFTSLKQEYFKGAATPDVLNSSTK
jgi:phytoene dehydrogenase-like protein